jgi:hypothetical protein
VSNSKFILFMNEIVVKFVVDHDNQMRKTRIISLKEQKKYLTEIEILMNFLIDEIDIKNEIDENRKFSNFDSVKYTTAKGYISAVINLYYQ